MKFITAVAALAATAAAVPTYGPPASEGKCNNNNPKYVCCDGLLGGILCNVNILGNNCAGGSYCCKTAPQVRLILLPSLPL